MRLRVWLGLLLPRCALGHTLAREIRETRMSLLGSYVLGKGNARWRM
jgi:hypothetical protein